VDLELTIVREAKRHDADAFHRLRSVPGIGKVLALTILYEIHIEKKHGKGKALSILAHKIGRAVFYMLSRGTVFSMEKFRAA
jgi:hypothetical protein